MSWVGTVLTILVVLTGVLMTFLILLQEGKGGGLAALGGTKAAGVEGVTNPIRRATAYLAVIFFVLLISLGVYNRPDNSILKFPAATTTGAKKEETKPAEGGLKVETPATVPATTPVTTPVTPEAPKTEAPKTDAPKTDAPKADAKAETPAAPAAPKTEEAKK